MTRIWPVTATGRRLAVSALAGGALGLAGAGYAVSAVSSPTASPASFTRSARIGGPPTLIVSGPAPATARTSARFTFVTRGPTASFACQLDATPAGPCTGDTTHPGGPARGTEQYAGLGVGRHCFAVRASRRPGEAGSAARHCWTVTGGRQDFTVGGDLKPPLFPGTSQPLELTFTNPGPTPLTFARGTVAPRNITISSKVAGCPSSYFSVARGLTVKVTIPARQRTAISLSRLGVPPRDWPVIAMTDSHTNQDACEGATLRLTYSGIEVSR